jgi:hypothetical protein
MYKRAHTVHQDRSIFDGMSEVNGQSMGHTCAGLSSLPGSRSTGVLVGTREHCKAPVAHLHRACAVTH